MYSDTKYPCNTDRIVLSNIMTTIHHADKRNMEIITHYLKLKDKDMLVILIYFSVY